MRKQFVTTAESIFATDPGVCLFLGDIGVYGFRNVLQKYSNRAFNIGILEQATIGVAAGFALNGYIPIVHTIAPFIVERAYEQIKIDFGYQNLSGNLVSVGASYDYPGLGCTHHCPADVSVLNNIPGMNIIIPGSEKEFDLLFRQTYHDGLNYFRLSEKSHHQKLAIKFGQALVAKKGKQKIKVITIGPIIDEVLEATSDIDVTVIYLHSLNPFDANTIKGLVRHTDTIITVEPFYTGVISQQLIENRINCQKIISIGIPRSFIHHYGTKEEIDHLCGADSQSIRQIIERETK